MTSEVPNPPKDATPRALPVGTRLEEFELHEVIGVGGFGIVYRAFDHSLQREVAVKEFMPASLVGRTETLHVSLRSESDAEDFQLGLKSFINEARLLASFNHPSLLRVYRYWAANSTAYLAMPVLQGQNLKALRGSLAAPPPEAQMRSLLVSLLGGLRHLHNAGVYHRDIAPDNIQIEPDGHPVLLDFGAARRVLSDKSQMLTAILKPAYAPIEQYGEAGSVRQGPWTDIYALGATLHFLLTGKPPVPSTVRALRDEAPPLARQDLPQFSQNFLKTIDWMLAPGPADRPQSVDALLAVLNGEAAPPDTRAMQPAPQDGGDETVVLPRPPLGGHRQASTGPVAPSPQAPPAVTAAQPAPARRSAAPLALAGLLAAALLGGAAWWSLTPKAPGMEAASAAGLVQEVTTGLSGPAGLQTTPSAAAIPASAGQPPAIDAAVPAAAAPRPSPSTTVKPAAPSGRKADVVRAAETPPAGSPVREAAPQPVAPTSMAPPEPPPAQAASPVQEGPVAICERKTHMPTFFCMERECLRRALAKHPECLKWRENLPKDPN